MLVFTVKGELSPKKKTKYWGTHSPLSGHTYYFILLTKHIVQAITERNDKIGQNL